MTGERAGSQCFLFLQGPHGPFFPCLGAALARRGHQVVRVNLNGGDAGIWRNAVNYHGTFAGWGRYVRRLMAGRGTTDLILYGDGRPMHATAAAIARGSGIRVHVFEEGYLRPDWVTLERNGVNGFSSLPRDIHWYLDQAATLPAIGDHAPLPSVSVQREWSALWYYLDIAMNHWRFPFYRSHRGTSPLQEMIAYLRRLPVRKSSRALSEREAHRLRRRPYFLFPLQLNTDYQIVRHSPFGGMEAAARHVLESFARNAPADTMLAVKEHPLDLGVINWWRVVDRLARSLGIRERVVFLDGGDLQVLATGARGMVTVNSTSGTLALAAGKPVKVLGDAVYDLPSITDQQALDAFWCGPTPPDAAAYDAFCRVLVDRCLLPGAFLNRQALPALIDHAVSRLLAPNDGRASPSSLDVSP